MGIVCSTSDRAGRFAHLVWLDRLANTKNGRSKPVRLAVDVDVDVDGVNVNVNVNVKSEPVSVLPDRGAVRDHGARDVDEREMMLGDGFPADTKRAVVVVPAVRTLDDPAARPTALALAWLLSAASKMRLDAASSRDRGSGSARLFQAG